MLKPRSEWEEFLNKRKSRGLIFTALVTVGFAVIILRLWHLQIVEHAVLSGRAESNRMRQITLDGRRGKIFDRFGHTLVDSRPSFQLSLIPEDVDDMEKILAFLGERIEFDPKEVLEKIKRSPSFQPVVIKRDIDRESVAFVEEHRLDLPGVFLETKAIRNYIYGDIAAHLFGYLSAITQNQFDAAEDFTYSKDDFVGQYGIEKLYEDTLRGSKGMKRVEVDAAGRELTQLGVINAKSGSNLFLTIDYDTQAAAEKAFEGKMGAAAAIDPKTGEVLAFVSKPSFDPNTFAYGISSKNWKALIGDEWHPLQNRVTHGQYPPGSTFKIVVAAGALEEGIINEQSTVFCPGYFTLGNRSYRCWKKTGHGTMDVTQALIQSCDVFFYTVGLKMGINKIARYAKIFGLGQKTGINLSSEKIGIIPSTKWKKSYKNEPWIMGETVSASIGQGYVLTTPIQQARMIAAVANRGKLVQPKLILNSEVTPDGKDNAVAISKENMEIVRNALRGVVAAPHGTAWRLRKGPYDYAGKTGTSQVVKMKKDEPDDINEIKLKFRDHAWFVSFAPFDDPQIAVAVIAEHAGHGGEAAAPIAKAMMDAYLDKVLPKADMEQDNNEKLAKTGEGMP